MSDIQQYEHQEVINALQSARDRRIKELQDIDSIIDTIKNACLKSLPNDETDSLFLQAAELSGELPYSFRFRTEPTFLNLIYFKNEWRMYNFTAIELHLKEFHLNGCRVSCNLSMDAEHLFGELVTFGFYRFCTIKLSAKDNKFYITLKQGY